MTQDITQLCRIVEGLIFASNNPISIDKLLSLFSEDERPTRNEIKTVLAKLQQDYIERGIELKELASGFQFQVKADLSSWVRELWAEKPQRYSRALLETLALVVYRQPITRGEIAEIRGVTSSGDIINTLLEKEWIKSVGRKEVPGRPVLYATTKKFLDDFGLKALSELPRLSEIQDLEQKLVSK